MTKAQILQAQVMSDFFARLMNPWCIYSDSELMKLYRTAQDNQDGRNITAIRNELNRRVREQ